MLRFGFFPLLSTLLSIQRNSKRFKTFHFNPEEPALQRVSNSWCDWKCRRQGVATPLPSVQMVSTLMTKASPSLLSFRNPDTFVAGELHRHVGKWEEILDQHPKQDEILSYTKSNPGPRIMSLIIEPSKPRLCRDERFSFCRVYPSL